jgi:hypothetical protein
MPDAIPAAAHGQAMKARAWCSVLGARCADSLLREFALHVRQNVHLSDCLHTASLLLEQLSDPKALGSDDVSKDAHVIEALLILY